MKEKPLKIAVFGSSTYTKAGVAALLKNGAELHHFAPIDSADTCHKLGLSKKEAPSFFYSSITSHTLREKLQNIAPNYVMVFGLTEKIPDTLIEIPTDGAFNVHPSLLPKYRGANPWFWVVYNREKQSGITAHKLTAEWDKGDIVEHVKFDINPLETVGTYYSKCLYYVQPLIDTLYPTLRSRAFNYKPQPPSPYQVKPSRKNYAIQWQRKAVDVEAQIRACNPGTAAFTILNGMLVTIHEAQISKFPATIPGKIVMKERAFYISASDVLLRIMVVEVKTEGVFSGDRFAQYCNLKTD